MPNICSNTPIKDEIIKGLRAELNFIRKSICSLQTGGGGGGNTIYTGDGSLPTDRTIDLGGHNLEFQQSGVDWFSMIPGNFTTQIRATDGTGTTYLVLNADVSDPTVKFELYSDNGTNEVSILGNATTDNIIYTADTHTFNGTFTINGNTGVTDDVVIQGLTNTYTLSFKDGLYTGTVIS
jgi:hypothetical protein